MPCLTIVPTSWTNAAEISTRDDGEPLSDHDPVVVEFDWVAELDQRCVGGLADWRIIEARGTAMVLPRSCGQWDRMATEHP